VAQGLVTSSQCWALRSIAAWQTNCDISGVYQDEVHMFKITQNTINGFTLAEILLMAAMNEIEAKRRLRPILVPQDLGLGNEAASTNSQHH
jgi:hypothetical protein